MIRTDLAFESARNFGKDLKGVKISVEEGDFFKVERVEITDENSAKILSKSCGNYVTISLSSVAFLSSDEAKVIGALSREISRLLPKVKAPFLVAGLGNKEITADSVGPRVISRVLATRHIDNNLKEGLSLSFENSIVAISPGVLGQTGMEAEEIIKAVKEEISAGCIIVIDALAAADKNRICSSVQISNSGINPGSGVGNSRKEISQRTLGVPVIAIGIPTVLDLENNLIVTHKNIDLCVETAASLISNAINLSLLPSLGLETIKGLI